MERPKKKWVKLLVSVMVAVLLVGLVPWRELRADANTHGEYRCTPLFVTYEQTTTWDRCTQGEFVVENTSDEVVNSWTLTVEYAAELQLTNVWNAKNVSDESTPGNVFVLGCEDFNSTIAPGESISFGLIAEGIEEAPVAPVSISIVGVEVEPVIEETVETITEESVPVEETTESIPVETIESVTTEITEETTYETTEEVITVETAETSYVIDDSVFSYAIFADSNVSCRGWKSNIVGNIYSGGNYSFQGSELNVDGCIRAVGTVQSSAWTGTVSANEENISSIEIPDWSSQILALAENMENLEYGDLTSQSVISVNGAYITDSGVTISCAEFGGEYIIVADGDIVFNLNSLSGEGNIILYSKNGNITINGSTADFTGIVYAPNGCISFNTYSVNINGRIVSQEVIFNGSILNVTADASDLDIISNASDDDDKENNTSEETNVDPVVEPTNEETEETTEPTGTDVDSELIFEGYASETLLDIGDGEDVLFFLVTNIEDVSIVELYEDGVMIAEMLDDGKYYDDGDDCGGDGIYSAKITVDNSVCRDIIYTMTLTTVDGEKYSCDVALKVDDMEAFFAPYFTSVEIINEYHDSEQFANGNIEIRVERTLAIIEQLVADGLIEPGSVENHDGVITFNTSSGINVMASCYDELPDHNGEDSSDNSQGHIPSPDFQAGSRVLYMVGMDNNHSLYENTRHELESKGVIVDMHYNPTYSDYCECLSQGNDVVVFACHGACGVLPCVKTGIFLDSGDDEKLKRIWYSALYETFQVNIDTNYELGIRPGFFTEQYSGCDSLPSAVVFLSCYSYGGETLNSRLAEAVHQIGVDYVICAHESIRTDYAADFAVTFLEAFCAFGYTGSEAFRYAKEIRGEDDSGYEDEAPIAKFYAYGDGTIRLHPRAGIQNPSFEDIGMNSRTGSPLRTQINNWATDGDVWLTFGMGPIEPRAGSYMMAVTTGVGAGESQVYGTPTVSTARQTFYVPEDCIGLTLSYNMVSEEPDEHLYSVFDDTFEIIIQDNTTQTTDIVYTHSIQTDRAMWRFLPRVDLANGDSTAYETGWITIDLDVTAYQGHAITLIFKAYDVGDSILDTAVLIDDIHMVFQY